MTDLHPNWQATDASGDEQALEVHVHEKVAPAPADQVPVTGEHRPAPMRRLSRQPAAIAGMLLAITIGASFFFASDRGTETTVHITQTGFSPKAVTVIAGADIRWINDTDRAQILQSDALCTRDQECFSTHSIAPNESATLTVTPDFDAGTYSYYSISTQGLEASITILASKNTPKKTAEAIAKQNLAQTVPFEPPAQSSSASVVSAQSSSALSVGSAPSSAASSEDKNSFVNITSLLTGTDQAPSSTPSAAASGLFDSDSSSTSSRPGSGPVAQLPINPYTVNSNRTHPFDEQGKPVTAGSSSSTKSSKTSKSTKATLHGGAPLPITQPETGPGLWITIFGTFCLLFLATYRLLRRQNFE